MFSRSPFLEEHYSLFAKYQFRFTIGGEEFDHIYYAADGIYQPLGIFLQPIPVAIARRGLDFDEPRLNDKQQFVRKDIERAFGMMLRRFKILRDCSKRKKALMGRILKACVILHDMILDDERGLGLDDEVLDAEGSPSEAMFHRNEVGQPLAANLQFSDAHDYAEHIRLRSALARELFIP